jgi:hypothetical protein
MTTATSTVPIDTRQARPLRFTLLLRLTGYANTIGHHGYPDADAHLSTEAVEAIEAFHRTEGYIETIGWREGDVTGTVELSMPEDELRDVAWSGYRGALEAVGDAHREPTPAAAKDTLTREIVAVQFFEALLEQIGWPAMPEVAA